MNLLFHYSAEKICRDEKGNLYISGNFTQEVWDRYLGICDRLDVVLRDSGEVLDEETALRKKQRIDTEKIHVHLLPDRCRSIRTFLSPKVKRQVKEMNKKLLSQSDFVIARPANSRIIRLCRKAGKPYAVEAVGCPWDALWNYNFKGKILAPVEFLYARREVKKAKWVLYVTEKFLQRRYPTNGRTVSCSNVSLNAVDEAVLTARLEKIQNMDGKKIILGTAASTLDVRYKGWEYVLKAMARLKKMGRTEFVYQVAGGGTGDFLRHLAKKLDIAEQLQIVGQMPHDKMFSWLQNLDIYIQPSLQEGLPRAVIEAMSCGLPCMGTDLAGIPELLNEKVLFRKKDVSALTEMLASMDKETMTALARENFEKAKQYDVTVLKERRQKFYQEFRDSIEGDIERCKL